MTKTYSEYAKVFDQNNYLWLDDLEANMIFLNMVQRNCNELLRSNGYLLLCEVYDRLGFERDDRSVQVGWIYKENNPYGDNFVDFGLHKNDFDKYTEKIILDFNVDGQIAELVSKF